MAVASKTSKIFQGIISGVLVFVFLASGTVKVTPRLDQAMHNKLAEKFIQLSAVHPAIKFGYAIDSSKYMFQVGVMEIAAALFLLIGPRPMRLLSCLLLSTIMIGALYSHYMLNDPVQELYPAAGLLLLLFMRLHFLLKYGGGRKNEKRD